MKKEITKENIIFLFENSNFDTNLVVSELKEEERWEIWKDGKIYCPETGQKESWWGISYQEIDNFVDGGALREEINLSFQKIKGIRNVKLISYKKSSYSTFKISYEMWEKNAEWSGWYIKSEFIEMGRGSKLEFFQKNKIEFDPFNNGLEIFNGDEKIYYDFIEEPKYSPYHNNRERYYDKRIKEYELSCKRKEWFFGLTTSEQKKYLEFKYNQLSKILKELKGGIS